MKPARLQPISNELETADLGDVRLNRRLRRIADAISLSPDASLPKACRTNAALEATYRLLSNPRVEAAMILEPHFAATHARASGSDAVFAIHDTTEFGFGGESRGHLGRTNNKKPGFFAHISLAVRASDREVLGVLGCRTWARQEPASTKAERKTLKYMSREDKESNRWCDAVDETEARFRSAAPLIHVADREGDQYRLLAKVIELGGRFIIRSTHDRVLADDDGTITTAVSKAKVVLRRTVQLSRRRPIHNRANHGPRESREAVLAVSATSVDVQRSWGPSNKGTPESLSLNVVRVVEAKPPADVDPVEWLLLTNLPIETTDEIAFIVDGYRARWTIEELFKAVKTGCTYEKLQLENERALTNALAIVLPIAWQMLLLRSLARADHDVPAARVLTKRQLQVLAHSPWTKLPARPTAKDALRAIATLGGHIKNNGDPGWQVLYGGFRDLMLLELGWVARSDQS